MTESIHIYKKKNKKKSFFAGNPMNLYEVCHIHVILQMHNALLFS